MKSIPIIVCILIITLCGWSCLPRNNSGSSPSPERSKKNSIKPLFSATSLIGKSPNEVESILGSPTDSWKPRTGTGNLMQSYALGEDMTIEFESNRISSLVIFFSQKNADKEMAYQLVGLDLAEPKPAGISKITTGEGWIKIFY